MTTEPTRRYIARAYPTHGGEWEATVYYIVGHNLFHRVASASWIFETPEAALRASEHWIAKYRPNGVLERSELCR